MPTRHYAAALVATGAAFGCRHDVDTAFYDELFGLPLNTDVMYHEPGWRPGDKAKEHPGRIVEKSSPGESRFLVFKRNHKASTVKVPESHAHLLRPEPTASEKRNAATITYRSPLHELLLHGCDQGQALFAARHDVLLVGGAAVLRRDLSLTVSATHDGHFVQGQLGDLVHVRDWHTNGNCGFLSTQLTDGLPPDLRVVNRYPVVIFDGPGGYQQWRDDLRHAHHVVLIDRTGTNLDTARTVLQEAHFSRDVTGDDLAPLPFPRPVGVEALTFQRRRA